MKNTKWRLAKSGKNLVNIAMTSMLIAVPLTLANIHSQGMGASADESSLGQSNWQPSTWRENSSEEIKTALDKQGIKENLGDYVVQWGDTLGGISKATGLSVNDLVNRYQIANADLIWAGVPLGQQKNYLAGMNSVGNPAVTNGVGVQSAVPQIPTAPATAGNGQQQSLGSQSSNTTKTVSASDAGAVATTSQSAQSTSAASVTPTPGTPQSQSASSTPSSQSSTTPSQSSANSTSQSEAPVQPSQSSANSTSQSEAPVQPSQSSAGSTSHSESPVRPSQNTSTVTPVSHSASESTQPTQNTQSTSLVASTSSQSQASDSKSTSSSDASLQASTAKSQSTFNSQSAEWTSKQGSTSGSISGSVSASQSQFESQSLYGNSSASTSHSQSLARSVSASLADSQAASRAQSLSTSVSASLAGSISGSKQNSQASQNTSTNQSQTDSKAASQSVSTSSATNINNTNPSANNTLGNDKDGWTITQALNIKDGDIATAKAAYNWATQIAPKDPRFVAYSKEMDKLDANYTLTDAQYQARQAAITAKYSNVPALYADNVASAAIRSQPTLLKQRALYFLNKARQAEGKSGNITYNSAMQSQSDQAATAAGATNHYMLTNMKGQVIESLYGSKGSTFDERMDYLANNQIQMFKPSASELGGYGAHWKILMGDYSSVTISQVHNDFIITTF